jgi:hypothetical protein
MKFCRRTLSFAVMLMAAIMAANELPELLSLTDNTTNDYVFVRSQSHGQPPVVVKDLAGQLTAAPVVFSLPVRLRAAADSSFLRSPTAKSPNILLLLLAMQRT